MPTGVGQAVHMTDAMLAEQVAYYRARAAEYDATAYGDGGTAAARIAAVAGLRIDGDVLELACGTGMWTRALARSARTLTAVDSAEEALRIARARCPRSVRFEVADVFTWQPARRYHVVFFAFWLSHVPTQRYPEFFAAVRDWLAPGGRVVFVDEPPSVADKEVLLSAETVARTLTDGTQHRIVKVFLEPGATSRQLASLGWTSEIALRGDWLVATARPC